MGSYGGERQGGGESEDFPGRAAARRAGRAERAGKGGRALLEAIISSNIWISTVTETQGGQGHNIRIYVLYKYMDLYGGERQGGGQSEEGGGRAGTAGRAGRAAARPDEDRGGQEKRGGREGRGAAKAEGWAPIASSNIQ